METVRYEAKDIETIADLLKEGKVVAFPTDTVYGLAVIYENEAALEALKKVKEDQKINQSLPWFQISDKWKKSPI